MVTGTVTKTSAAVRRAELEAVLAYLAARPWPDGVDEARAHYDALGEPIAEDLWVEPLTIERAGAQLLTPPDCCRERAVLYLHGGGYVFGSLESHGGLVGEIARAARCQVLQLDYRRAPEHPFPAAVEDAAAAYRWLLARGFAAERIAIVGDSAGGGLVLCTLVHCKDQGVPLAGAAVCLSPWVDLEATGESYRTRARIDPLVQRKVVDEVTRHYLNGSDPRAPTASPIHADLTGFPPLLIQVGEREILYSDAEALARKARALGLDVTFEEWPDMVHVWHLHYPRLATAREAIARIGRFVREKLASPIVGPHVHRNNQKMIPASERAWRVAQDAHLLGIRVDATRGQNHLRELDTGHEFANLCSCSYLGLNSHPDVLQGGVDALRAEAITGLSMAEFRIRLGLMERLEQELAELYGGPVLPGVTASALTAAILPVLGSGHLTRSAPLVMAFDRFAHFSMQFMRPIVADETRVVTVPHNDMGFLEDLCRRYPRVAYVCDGVYSTGGATDLPALLALQERYGLFLYLDDSHGLSIQGPRGEGYIRARLPSLNERTLIVASIAKAFGSTGGVAMLGSRRHHEFLYRTGPMGWSQALRTAAIGTSLGSLQVHRSPELGARQAQLARNIALFDQHVETAQRGDGLHIRIVELGEPDRAVALSRELYQRGFYCSAVCFPIVPRGQAGIRIMLRGDLPTAQVQAFIDHLREARAALEDGRRAAT